MPGAGSAPQSRSGQSGALPRTEHQGTDRGTSAARGPRSGRAPAVLAGAGAGALETHAVGGLHGASPGAPERAAKGEAEGGWLRSGRGAGAPWRRGRPAAGAGGGARGRGAGAVGLGGRWWIMPPPTPPVPPPPSSRPFPSAQFSNRSRRAQPAAPTCESLARALSCIETFGNTGSAARSPLPAGNGGEVVAPEKA